MPNIAPIIESIIVLIIVNFQKRFAFEKRNQNKMANSSVNKTNSPLIEESRKRKNTNQLTKLQINSLIIIDLWIEYIIYCIDLNICLYNILA